MLDAAAAVQAIEKVAFAVTEGLYDGRTCEFVSDAAPDRELAVSLVHSTGYELRCSVLQAAAADLRHRSQARTDGLVGRMRERLNTTIAAAIGVDLALLPLLLLAILVLRRRVLAPIAHLRHGVGRYTDGDDQARTARRCVAHAARLIDDALDFSKIEAAQSIELVRQAAQQQEIELVCELADPSLPAHRGTLRGDALHLQQVPTHLLSDAVKFTGCAPGLNVVLRP